MGKQAFVYILASGKHGTLYVGVTTDLMARLDQHRAGLIEGFTKEHEINRLVYFEEGDDIAGAIKREKQLKKWNREWKINLIERHNPQWVDLAVGLGFAPVGKARSDNSCEGGGS